jgi:hypothetical protein
MRTPAGTECKYYYEDFHRGRDVQECRCPKDAQSSLWQTKICAVCPVPAILSANASPHLEITINIRQTLLGFGRRVTYSTWCLLHEIPIDDPKIGCTECNKERPGLDLFMKALDDLD